MKSIRIEDSPNAVIRGSFQAMIRAAEAARQEAIRTNTRLVLYRDGRVVYVDPRTGEEVGTPGDSPEGESSARR